jgi:hypothetical protein
MRETREFQERMGRIEGLVHKLESATDPALQKAAQELIAALMEMHAGGIERILEIAAGAGEAGSELVQSLAGDELVGGLLVLHGLHPDSFETRVRRGLEKARPILHSQGAHLEAIEIGESTVRVRIVGSPSNDLEAAVRNALFETAPDAADVAIEGTSTAVRPAGFVPLASLLAPDGSPVIIAQAVRP